MSKICICGHPRGNHFRSANPDTPRGFCIKCNCEEFKDIKKYRNKGKKDLKEGKGE